MPRGRGIYEDDAEPERDATEAQGADRDAELAPDEQASKLAGEATD